MLTDILLGYQEQIRHLVLVQPDGFTGHTDFNTGSAVVGLLTRAEPQNRIGVSFLRDPIKIRWTVDEESFCLDACLASTAWILQELQGDYVLRERTADWKD